MSRAERPVPRPQAAATLSIVGLSIASILLGLFRSGHCADRPTLLTGLPALRVCQVLDRAHGWPTAEGCGVEP